MNDRSERLFKRPLAIGLIALLLAATVEARERQESYAGARSLGMGGTSVASVNDETALAANPAALGKLRNFYGTILDPELDVGSHAQGMYRSQSFSQPTAIDNVMPSLLASPGEYYSFREQIFPSFVAKNFGIGLLYSSKLAGEAISPTQADLFYRNDLSLLLGYNLRLWGGRIKIGFSGKVISRRELNESNFDPTQALDEPSLEAAGLLKEGTGVGADVGVILTAPWAWLPSVAAVLRDVGGTSFSQSAILRSESAVNHPDTAPQDLDVGLSVSPIHTNNIRSLWTIEYKSLLTASSETDKAKLLHFGVEWNFGDVFFLRAGYNQRYWTAGAELASEHLQFQLASYGEEIGDETNPREDRRLVLKAAFRF